MSVRVIFECDGCPSKTEARLKSEFVSISGRSYGLGRRIEQKASELAPDGWIAFDPYTGCCYCPTCWQSIMEPEDVAKAFEGEA